MGGSSTPGVQESPLQVSQAQIASQQFSDYQKRWVPVQQYFTSRTENNLGAKQQLAEGAANTDIRGQYGAAASKLNTALTSHGIMTGSNRDIMAQNNLSNDEAGASGLSRTATDTAVQRQYQAGLSDIVGMGRGQKATSDQALSTLADQSGQQAAASAEVSEQNAAGLGAAAGTLIGTPAGYGLASLGNRQSQPAAPNYGINPPGGG